MSIVNDIIRKATFLQFLFVSSIFQSKWPIGYRLWRTENCFSMNLRTLKFLILRMYVCLFIYLVLKHSYQGLVRDLDGNENKNINIDININ